MIALKNSGSKMLGIADASLMMPDLLRYSLCGQRASELTIASNSQLLNLKTKNWIPKLFRLFNLPRHIMPQVVEPGVVAGQLLPEVAAATGIQSAPVITIAGHDTASAAAGRGHRRRQCRGSGAGHRPTDSDRRYCGGGQELVHAKGIQTPRYRTVGESDPRVSRHSEEIDRTL